MGRLLNTLGVGIGGAAGAALTGDAAGFAQGVAGMGGAVLLPRQVAKLFTNPRFVSWLAETPLQQVDATSNAAANAAWAGHVGRLSAIADQEFGINNEVLELQEYLNRDLNAPMAADGQPPRNLTQNLVGEMPPQLRGRLTDNLLGR